MFAKFFLGDEKMRSRLLTTFFVLVIFLIAPDLRARAQNAQATDKNQEAVTTGATKEEVEQLRAEVAAQKQTIEELKAMVQHLAEGAAQNASASSPQTVPAAPSAARLVSATYVEPSVMLVEQATPAAPAAQAAAPAKKPGSDVPVTAGWNGDHFFIKSSDGQFQLMPYGYVQTDYRGYRGDGAPANTFQIRRARFGFQGNYGKYYDFAVLLDAAAGNGISLRDLFLNVKPIPQFQVQVGQFKIPFAQEEMTAVTNIDFVERSMASNLYPSATTAFRSPGVTIHGDIDGGVIQYWAGAFNGKGILTNNTTNQPEAVARLRVYPWRKKKDSLVQGLAFGASGDIGRTRALSNELSVSGVIPDFVYNFIPTFRINGYVQRYEGETTWVHGPWAIRAEFDDLKQMRSGLGSFQAGGLGFTDLPGIESRAGYAQATYLLTGETRPENGTPKVKHPLLGPEGAGSSRGWGAWEVAFRYNYIHVNEPGAILPSFVTPGLVPTFNDHTDGFTAGVNWYLNNWVKYQINLDIDRLKEPSVQGQIPQTFYVVLNRLQFRF